MTHVGKEIRFRQVSLVRHGHGVVQFQFELLARGIVCAYQQIADDGVLRVAERCD